MHVNSRSFGSDHLELEARAHGRADRTRDHEQLQLQHNYNCACSRSASLGRSRSCSARGTPVCEVQGSVHSGRRAQESSRSDRRWRAGATGTASTSSPSPDPNGLVDVRRVLTRPSPIAVLFLRKCSRSRRSRERSGKGERICVWIC